MTAKSFTLDINCLVYESSGLPARSLPTKKVRPTFLDSLQGKLRRYQLMKYLLSPGSPSRPSRLPLLAVSMLALTVTASVFAQSSQSLNFNVSASDRAAAASSSHFWYHARSARTAAAQSAPRTLFTAARPKMTGLV